jgi:hypothetical protein
VPPAAAVSIKVLIVPRSLPEFFFSHQTNNSQATRVILQYSNSEHPASPTYNNHNPLINNRHHQDINKMAILQSTVSRPLLLATRTMQWVSSVIAMGFYAYFVHREHHGTHPIFNLVISVLSVVFFIPAFLSPFKSTILSKWVALIDMVFSYLYVFLFFLS